MTNEYFIMHVYLGVSFISSRASIRINFASYVQGYSTLLISFHIKVFPGGQKQCCDIIIVCSLIAVMGVN